MSQGSVFNALEEMGGSATIEMLARKLECSQATICKNVRALEKQALIGKYKRGNKSAIVWLKEI